MNKIILFFIVLLAVLIVFMFISKNSSGSVKSVLGAFNSVVPASFEKAPETKASGKTNDFLINVKDQISRLTPDNIASSTDTIQNIINDLKLIQENKKQPKDVVCETLCK